MAPTPSENRTVLVVDDDTGVCDVMAMTIEGAGYDALKARNGEEAIEIARGRASDLVLVVLDMGMEGLGGPATWRAIHEIRQDLPFLFVSGDREDDVRAALATAQVPADHPSMRGILKKPFLPCDLRDKVKEALGA